MLRDCVSFPRHWKKNPNKKPPKTQKKNSLRSNKYRHSFVMSLSQSLTTSLKDPYLQSSTIAGDGRTGPEDGVLPRFFSYNEAVGIYHPDSLICC